MGTISANDMKLVADILAEITDEDVTKTPSANPIPPPMVVPPPGTRGTAISLGNSRPCSTPSHSHPGQPGLNMIIRPNSTTHSHPAALHTEDSNGPPSNVAASSSQRRITKKRARKMNLKIWIFQQWTIIDLLIVGLCPITW